MRVTFKYDPMMEVFPLKAGLHGHVNSEKTKFALRSIADGIDPSDRQAVATWATKIAVDDKIDLPAEIELMTAAWRAVEPQISPRLSKMFATDWDPGDVTAYLTLSQRCPYEPPLYFWVSYFAGDPIGTSLHEIQHFYTHRLIEPMFKAAGRAADFNDFKESLTVLLNGEFKDVMRWDDKGYPQHQELRQKIAAQYEAGLSIEAIAKAYL